MCIRSGLMTLGILVASLGLYGCAEGPTGDQTDSRVMRNSDAAGSLVNPNNRPDVNRAYYGNRTPPGQPGSNASPAPLDANNGASLTNAPVNDNVTITGTGAPYNGGNNSANASHSPTGSGNSTGNRGSEIGRGIGGTGSGGTTSGGTSASTAGGGR